MVVMGVEYGGGCVCVVVEEFRGQVVVSAFAKKRNDRTSYVTMSCTHNVIIANEVFHYLHSDTNITGFRENILLQPASQQKRKESCHLDHQPIQPKQSTYPTSITCSFFEPELMQQIDG
jgi:hypothetical protein